MDMGLIISLISGAVGGNVAGGLLKNMNLGVIGNSLSGIVGGAGLSSLLPMLGMAAADPTAGAGAMDIGSIVANGASGLVGGGGLMAIIGTVKNAMGR